MKNVIKLLTAGAAFLAASALFGQTVTITMNTQLANAAGTPTNGMLYGIVVDTLGNGFDPGLTGGAAGPGIGEQMIGIGANFALLDAAGVPTDDIVYVAGNVTVNQPVPPPGMDGMATTVAAIPMNGNPGAMGVDAGQQWGAIWFPTLGAGGGMITQAGGDTAGFNTDGLNVIPPAGSTVTQDNMVDGVSGDIPTVPEPSTYAAIFGLVVLGLAYLRRRK
jgi:hypothetical protein